MASSNTNQTVIALNNQGASLIQSARATEAVATLTEALKSSKQLLTAEPSQSDVDSELYLLDGMMAKRSVYATKDCDYETGGNFICKQVMYASEDMRSDDNTSTVLLAIAVVFNLALAHHLIGIERGSDFRSLEKAVKLYEYAFSLARSHGVDNCVLFHLSIMNNLGQLLRALGHEEQAGKCFQQLLSMLMCLLDCSDGGASRYADFLANVSYLIVPSCSVAAAA
jgi:tetratricopeptide (TPR) repeat protein